MTLSPARRVYNESVAALVVGGATDVPGRKEGVGLESQC